MNLLFVTSLVPDGKPASGYELANAAILAGLSASGARVTAVGYRNPASSDMPGGAVVLGTIDPRTDTASAALKLKWLAKSVVAGVPFACGKLRNFSEASVRRQVDDAGPFDAYVLNGVALAGAYERLFTEKPFLFVAHNVEYRTAQQNEQAATGLVERYMYGREAVYLEALERRLCGKAAHVFALTEADREELCGSDTARSSVIPLTTMDSVPSVRKRSLSHDVSLIGTWTWRPNRIGLEWFLDEVAPHLDKDIVVRVAGSTPAGFADRYPNAGFAGRVPDAIEFVRSGAVVALASRAGTGVQLKTIETFELGLPSVATTSSMRGLSYKPENCDVTDDPRAFAAALNAKVRAIRAGTMLDVDGRVFHDTHVRQLNDMIRAGLSAIGQGT